MESKQSIALTPEPQAPLSSPGRTPKKSSLAGDIAWRAIANWSSQLVSWAALLVLVRVLAPSDFGLVSMSVVLYSYLRFVGEFGIPATVVTLRDLSENEIAQLNTMGLFFGAAAFLLAVAFAWPLAVFFKTAPVAPVAIVTCLALIPLGLRSVPEGLLAKEMRLKSLSVFDALRDIFSAAVTIVLAFLHFGYWALVIGNLSSIVIRSAIILSVRRHRFAWPHWESVKRPLIYSWHVLVSVFAWSSYNTLDNVTAGRVLGQAALGFYGMAWNLANMPLEKVVSLVTSIVPSYLAAVQEDPTALRRYLRNLSETVALATFPVTIGLALVAREAVPLVMGRKWLPMIAPLEVLCVYAAFRSMVALLPKLLTAVGKAQFVMRVEVAGLIIMPIAFYIGSHWGIAGIAYGWVVAYPCIAVPLFWKSFRTVEMTASEYLQALRPALDASFVMAAAVLLLKFLVPGSVPLPARLALEIAAGAAGYLATLRLLHRERARQLLAIVKRLRGPKFNREASSSLRCS